MIHQQKNNNKMRILSPWQTVLMTAGGMLTVGSAIAMMAATIATADWLVEVGMTAPWTFALGVMAFVSMQLLQRYEGGDFTVARLRRMLIISDICLVVAALLMIENVYHFVMPYVAHDLKSMITYLQVVRNNWVVLVLVAAILQLYATMRLSSELKKN